MYEPLAHHPHKMAMGLASLGRGGDKMLVHMSPSEVGGLQQIAKSRGKSLTINPHTGLPEAFGLEDVGSTIVDAVTGGGGDAAAAALDIGSTAADTASTLAELEPIITNATRVADVADTIGSGLSTGAQALAETAPAASSSIAGLPSAAAIEAPKNLFGITAGDPVVDANHPEMKYLAPKVSQSIDLPTVTGPGDGTGKTTEGFTADWTLPGAKNNSGFGDTIDHLLDTKWGKVLTNPTMLKALVPLVTNLLGGESKIRANDPNKPMFWNQQRKRVLNPNYGAPGQPYFIMQNSPGYFSTNYIDPNQMMLPNGQGSHSNPYTGLSALPTPRGFKSGGVIKNFADGGLTFSTFDPKTAALASPAAPPPSTAMDAYLAPMMASTYDPTLRPFLPSPNTGSTGGTGGFGPPGGGGRTAGGSGSITSPGGGGGSYGIGGGYGVGGNGYGGGGAGSGGGAGVGNTGGSTSTGSGGAGSGGGAGVGNTGGSTSTGSSGFGDTVSSIGDAAGSGISSFAQWGKDHPWANAALGLAVPYYGLAALGAKGYQYFKNKAAQDKANQTKMNASLSGTGGLSSQGMMSGITGFSGSWEPPSFQPTPGGSVQVEGVNSDILSGHAHGGSIHHEGVGEVEHTYAAGGKLLRGDGDGMSDSIPAVITGDKPQRAALADGEFVIPADVVSHLGNGSTEAGSRKLYEMMDKVRKARTGNPNQGKQINPDKFVPA